MEEKIFFEENQKFKQWWIWMILVLLNGFWITGLLVQVVFNEEFGTNPVSNEWLLIISGTTVIFTGLFFSLRLETKISSKGIYVRLFPFHISFKHFLWETIKKCYVRKYKPMMEYGGWGIRFSFSGKGKAYNVSGNTGLQLELQNGKKLLIGTELPEILSDILRKENKLIS